MTVTVDSWAVVIRREAIDAGYVDGWAGFLEQLPAERLQNDGAIASFALVDEEDVAAFVAALTEGGLTAEDFVVLESSRGPRGSCDWLERVVMPAEPSSTVTAWQLRRRK